MLARQSSSEGGKHKAENDLAGLKAKPFVLSQKAALRSVQAWHTIAVSSEVKN